MAEWDNYSREKLIELYVKNNIPSDPLIAQKEMLGTFTNKLNKLIEGDVEFTAEEVAKELLRVRKNAKLPRIRQ